MVRDGITKETEKVDWEYLYKKDFYSRRVDFYKYRELLLMEEKINRFDDLPWYRRLWIFITCGCEIGEVK